MLIALKLYKRNVYIPTCYRIKGQGFFYEHAPVSVVPAMETDALRQTILAAAEIGGAEMSFEEYRTRRDGREGSLLEATKCKSWYAFDRQMTGSWSITDRGGPYQIQVDQPMKPHGWHEDKEKRVEFAAGTSIDDVTSRVIDMIQKREQEQKTGSPGTSPAL